MLLGPLGAFGAYVLLTSPKPSLATAYTYDPQTPSRIPREKPDRRFTASARERGEAFLSKEEERLLKSIVRSGRRRDWAKASAMIWEYSGAQTPIYSAALYASIRCRRYDEGASIYDEMCGRSVWRDLPTFSMALKIFSKSSPGRVQQIWEEAVGQHPLDAALCAARLDAAAGVGDTRAAREVLETMQNAGLSPNLLHFTSAIRACKENESNESHEMAKEFFELALRQGVEPDLVAFRELIGACRRAPLLEVQAMHNFMKEMNLEADPAFCDVYLRTVLQLPKSRRFRSVTEAVEELKAKLGQLREEESLNRLAEARLVLEDFAGKGQLTAFGHLLNGALQQLQ